jgi:hypothetical protein
MALHAPRLAAGAADVARVGEADVGPAAAVRAVVADAVQEVQAVVAVAAPRPVGAAAADQEVDAAEPVELAGAGETAEDVAAAGVLSVCSSPSTWT